MLDCAIRFFVSYSLANHRYTGQRSDAGIGLYYYGARYYDASLGRFVQADTIVPDPGKPRKLVAKTP